MFVSSADINACRIVISKVTSQKPEVWMLQVIHFTECCGDYGESAHCKKQSEGAMVGTFLVWEAWDTQNVHIHMKCGKSLNLRNSHRTNECYSETHPAVKNLSIAVHFYFYCNLMHPSVRANCQVLFKYGNRNAKVSIDQWVSISLQLTKDGACHFKCNLRSPIAGSSWKCYCNWQVLDCRMRLWQGHSVTHWRTGDKCSPFQLWNSCWN